jgi:hypothetical protein
MFPWRCFFGGAMAQGCSRRSIRSNEAVPIESKINKLVEEGEVACPSKRGTLQVQKNRVRFLSKEIARQASQASRQTTSSGRGMIHARDPGPGPGPGPGRTSLRSQQIVLLAGAEHHNTFSSTTLDTGILGQGAACCQWRACAKSCMMALTSYIV